MTLRIKHILQQAAEEGADTGGAPAGAEDTGNAGGTGAADPAQTGQQPSAPDYSWLPEKFHVKNDAGELDISASAQKQAESYAALEKWKGTSDIPPDSPDKYAVTIPDDIAEGLDLENDPVHQDFRKAALEAGMTQKQFDVVMGKYFEILPNIVNASHEVAAEVGAESLKQVWQTEQQYNDGLKQAFQGAKVVAEMAGIDIAEIESGPLRNNPTFIRMMAAINKEFKEDTPPASASASTPDIQTLMASEAYTNPKHPDHAAVSKQISEHYEKKHGTDRI